LLICSLYPTSMTMNYPLLSILPGLLMCACISAFAQKEANVWLFDKYEVNFNYQPPKVSSFPQIPTGAYYLSSITDKEGKLLFYTDGKTVWNRNHGIMSNGTGLNGYFLNNLHIIPKPGSQTNYYLFYVGNKNVATPPTIIDLGIYYTEIDILANNGQGAVIQKNVQLHYDMHGGLTVAGFCNNEYFWILGERNDNVTDANTDRIYAYRLDAEGVNHTPVISAPVGIGHSNAYRFSPSGTRLAFSYGGSVAGSIDASGVADFDPLTGKVSNVINIDQINWGFEFSPDEKFLYATSDSTLKQFNLAAGDAIQIRESKTVLYQKQPGPADLQLTSDGKIYVSFYGTNYLAAIESPEKPGEACSFNPRAIELPDANIVFLPKFASTFLTNIDIGVSVTADAGPDQAVCQDKTVTIGGLPADARLQYRWQPADYLSDARAANPVFRYPAELTKDTTIQYVLTTTNGNCPSRDTVRVTVYPLPGAPAIAGSASVCPGVAAVDYRVLRQEGYTYRWEVKGGEIIRGQGTDSIQVNWGATNPAAWVRVEALDERGCISQPAIFPVRIHVELQTETPRGDTVLCFNDKDNLTYQVGRTNGSVYTWQIVGGDITAGQGTHRVRVNWYGEGRHALWVQEQSVTVDTICYGISDTLRIRVFRDTTDIHLSYLSVHPDDESKVQVFWRGNNFSRVQGNIRLLRREAGTLEWTEVVQLPAAQLSYTDNSRLTDEWVYEYQLVGENACTEKISSSVHNTIRLTGQADTGKNHVALAWNAYEGWPGALKRYEIWRRVDEERDFRLVHSSDAQTLTFGADNGREGFTHRYRIKAVNRDESMVSWSNEIELTFTHELFIPNVLTVNGDGKNETFEIRNIELYPQNELTILNRYGKEVFRQQQYLGGWWPLNLSPGVYYYRLLTHRDKRTYQGWLHVLN
jgi:gliding motility-associated-like protein